MKTTITAALLALSGAAHAAPPPNIVGQPTPCPVYVQGVSCTTGGTLYQPPSWSEPAVSVNDALLAYGMPADTAAVIAERIRLIQPDGNVYFSTGSIHGFATDFGQSPQMMNFGNRVVLGVTIDPAFRLQVQLYIYRSWYIASFGGRHVMVLRPGPTQVHQ